MRRVVIVSALLIIGLYMVMLVLDKPDHHPAGIETGHRGGPGPETTGPGADPGEKRMEDREALSNLSDSEILVNNFTVYWAEVDFFKGIDKLMKETGIRIVIEPEAEKIMFLEKNVKTDLDIVKTPDRIVELLLIKTHPESAGKLDVVVKESEIHIVAK